MKAVLCVAPGQLELVERPLPKELKEGQTRLAVSHIGICGTDYHIFEGKHPFLEYPRIMGHEISATVLETAGDSRLRKGDVVIVNPYLSCGTCIACRNDKPNCCINIRVLGVHTDGAFCEEIVVPSQNVYAAEGLNAEQAATVEFLAIGAHAVRRAGEVKRGARALVIGAGPIGLGTALFARLAGFHVTLLDMSLERLDVAKSRFAFSSVIAGGENAALLANEITAGEGFEAVFDATGNARSMISALPFVSHGGILVYVSVVKDDIVFSDPEFHKREMMIIGSRNALKEDFLHVARSIANGDIDTSKLLTHRTTLAGSVRDLPVWAHEKTGLIKAVIQAQG